MRGSSPASADMKGLHVSTNTTMKMPAVRAVETEYAGEKFRSRLEARVAYVLDLLGIVWVYEPDAYELRDRLGFYAVPGEGDPWSTPIRYLPDFWLPDVGKFIEVKGEFRTDDDYKRFLSCAAGLSEQQHNVVLFAKIPGPAAAMRLPVELGFYKGTLYGDTWCPEGGSRVSANSARIAMDNGEVCVTAAHLLSGREFAVPVSARVQEAFRLARHAKFDHGKTPSGVVPVPDPNRARSMEELHEQFTRQANPYEVALWRQIPDTLKAGVLRLMGMPIKGVTPRTLVIDDYRTREKVMEQVIQNQAGFAASATT